MDLSPFPPWGGSGVIANGSTRPFVSYGSHNAFRAHELRKDAGHSPHHFNPCVKDRSHSHDLTPVPSVCKWGCWVCLLKASARLGSPSRAQEANTRPAGWIPQQWWASCPYLRSTYIYIILILHSALRRQPWGWSGPWWKWVGRPWLPVFSKKMFPSSLRVLGCVILEQDKQPWAWLSNVSGCGNGPPEDTTHQRPLANYSEPV